MGDTQFPIVDSIEVTVREDMCTLSDKDSELEEKKKAILANTTERKDLDATDVVLRGESKEQVTSFDRTLPEGDIHSEAVEDHKRFDLTSIPFRLLGNGDDLSIMADVEHEKRSGFFPKESISSLQLNESWSGGSPAISNLVNVDSVMKDDGSTFTDNNLCSLTGRKDDSSMEGAMVYSERTDMLSGMDFKARGLKYTYTKRNKSVILEGKHVSQQSSTDNSSNPLTGKKDNNLMEGAMVDSKRTVILSGTYSKARDVKYTYKKRNKSVILEGKHISLGNFKSAQENVRSPISHNSYKVHESENRVRSDKLRWVVRERNHSKSTNNGGETTDSQKEAGVRSSGSVVVEDVISSYVVNLQSKLKAVSVPPRALISRTRKTLLVLDLNGLLADIHHDYCSANKAYKKINGKSVFKRPFCDEFLKFCFERFNVGVWSSRRKYNVDAVVDFLMGDLKHNLLFCWDQSKCTNTGFRTLENMHKPLVLKELKKLWNKEENDLQWEKGDYSPSNTLLVDDSPYKALRNPPYTAIFPHSYHLSDESDRSLGQGGDLRVYLEGLAVAGNVQQYVQENPFGQLAITDSSPSWEFYLRIMDKFDKSSAPVATR